MKTKSFIQIDNDSPVPKYRQIINAITDAIDQNKLIKGEKIPSINSLIRDFSLSQDTILVAYNHLKSRGIISSQVGKGYYVAHTRKNQKRKIFLLFDSLSGYKETLLASFTAALGKDAVVDIFFHHFNQRVFNNLIEDAIGNYTSYVVMPIPEKKSMAALKKVPDKKLFILDQGGSTIGKIYPSVCQNFENDLYNGLVSGITLLTKYSKLVLVTASEKYHFGEIIQSFLRFCRQYGFKGELVQQVNDQLVKKGEIYIVINDRDLVHLVQKAKESKLKLGKDCGIISYNDTPLKEVVADGISVISTDFSKMGLTMAEMIKNKKIQQVNNPSSLIIRNSL